MLVPITKEADARGTSSERINLQESAANKITDEEKEGEFDEEKGYWRY